LDIGCAEGYYAVGLGLMFPKSKIIAYDIIEKARKLCRKMAEFNNIGDRIELRAKCTSEDLQNFEFDRKTLIICDAIVKASRNNYSRQKIFIIYKKPIS
jgi:methylase of polypeptide subunit release factors